MINIVDLVVVYNSIGIMSSLSYGKAHAVEAKISYIDLQLNTLTILFCMITS